MSCELYMFFRCGRTLMRALTKVLVPYRNAIFWPYEFTNERNAQGSKYQKYATSPAMNATSEE